jgi:hypothetical protein
MAGIGGPVGNQNAAKAKRWEAAILRALEAWPAKPDSTGCNALMLGINEAAHGFVAKMMAERDISFFREFGDRIDGKPAQAITGGDGGGLVITINATRHDEAL